MWWSSFAILAAVIAWLEWKRGPRVALGVAAMLSVLVPSWSVWSLFGQPVHMRVAICLVALGLYCVHPDATFRTRLTLADFALAALFVIHFISDCTNSGFTWGIPLRAYGEWVVPYLTGRLAVQEIDDARDLLPWAVFTTIVLSALCCFESVSSLHPWEWVYGRRPDDGILRDARRWGLLRPWGPTMHFIFSGALQLLFVPWAVYSASRARRLLAPTWWLVVPAIAVVGVMSSLSRAPMLALLIVLYAVLFIRRPAWRKRMAIAGVIACVLLVWQRDRAIHALQVWTGEADKHGMQIVVDGEEVEYSGTMNRIYLFQVYRTAMRQAGWVGYGTERVTGFPIRVPMDAKNVDAVRRVRYIDNAFILLELRFGYLGIACFVLFGIASVITAGAMAWYPGKPGGLFLATLAGTLCGILFVMMTVWMPFDYGFTYLFSAGVVAGLRGNRD